MAPKKLSDWTVGNPLLTKPKPRSNAPKIGGKKVKRPTFAKVKR